MYIYLPPEIPVSANIGLFWSVKQAQELHRSSWIYQSLHHGSFCDQFLIKMCDSVFQNHF
jgi:hypothetical protein